LLAIIDDDDAIRDSLRLVLEVAGFAAAEFPSAEAFLATPAAKHDFLIVDINLPGISGVELLEKLRVGGNTVPVLLISARLSAAIRARGRAAGAVALLEKPCDGQEIVRFVKGAVER
jgi:FixJ family two-component response regulator